MFKIINEMKDRIRKFIDYKGVTPGELAARIDVQRSNISHVLNGRNKPGASFIERFLIEFPDLNARWLLIGSGDMVLSKKDKVKELFDKEDYIFDKKVKKEPASVISESGLKKIQDIQTKDEVIVKTSEKTIEKIVMFFKDKTFSEYHPE